MKLVRIIRKNRDDIKAVAIFYLTLIVATLIIINT